ANVVLTDISEQSLEEAEKTFKKDQVSTVVCDVTDENSIKRAFDKACLSFGGIDVIIHSAGLAISKSLEDTTLKDWEILQNILVKCQFLMAKHGMKILKKQGLRGNIVNIDSKSGLVAVSNNVSYGTA